MKNGLLRNIRLVWHNFTINGLQLLLTIPILFLYFSLLEINIPPAGIAALFTLMMPLFMSMSSISAIYKYAASFSTTKRNFYIASFFNKFLYMFFPAATTFILSASSDFSPFNTGGAMVLLVALSIALGALGEFYGLIMLRSQKLGFIVYMISCCGLMFSSTGIFTHFIFKYPDDNILNLLYSNLSIPLVFAVITAIFAALTVINWVLLKKTEIRS